MKPEKIVMQAFGPYMQRCEVDFTELNRAQIFLISGPTGSGKTTILDAMSFALYGEPTGELREWKQMRNTACSQEVPTIAEVQFALGEEHFLFRRTLTERMRKKRTGEMETVYEQESECFRMEERQWSLLASGGQVSAKAKELLGFSKDQFSQVIVLPQGEFKKLLVASSTEKEAILQTLFSTGQWLRFTRAAEELFQQLQKSQQDQMGRRDLLFHQEGVESTRQLQQMIEKAQQRYEQAREKSDQMARKAQQIARELEVAQSLNDQFQRLQALKKAMQELDGQKEEMEHLLKQVKADEQARRLLPFYESFSSAQKESLAKKQQQSNAQKDQKNAEKEFEEAQKQMQETPEMERQQEKLQQWVTELNQACEDQRRKREAETALRQCQKEQRVCEQSLTVCQQKEQQLQARVEKGEKVIRVQFEQYVQKLPDLMAQLQQLEAAKEKWERIVQLKKDEQALKHTLTAIEKKRKEEKTKLDSLRDSVLLLEAAVRKDHAFHLALSLRDGEACPVCGSISHPAPAQACDETPPSDKVEDARVMAQQAQQSFQEIEIEVNRQETALLATQKALFESTEQFQQYNISPDQLTSRLFELQKAVKEAQEASDHQPKYQQALQKLKDQIEQCRRQLTQQQQQYAACQSRTAAAQARLEEVSKRLEKGHVDEASLQLQRKKAEQDLLSIKTAMERFRQAYQQASSFLAAARQASTLSQQALQEAMDREDTAKKKWVDCCEQEGIKPDQKFLNLLLEEFQRQQMRETFEQYSQKVHTTKAQLSQLQEELKEKEPPCLDKLRSLQAELLTQKADADKQVGMLHNEVGRMTGELEELRRLEEDLNRLDRRYTRVSRLAEFLRGKNAYNTPIHQFVLGMMLDDIVATANKYLDRLSRGQYSLVRMDAKGGRGYRGLELYVMDAHRGGMRTVRTLSGGELFLASLSLAFGLSDVVQGYAGGVRLDSIFIDEGFGTLDEETLDAAMMALSQIQSSGRMVGIISHVQELKDRIGARIEILPDQNGGSRAVVRQ